MAELEHRRIASRIKEARKATGLTQQQMAELLGVIQRTYQNYESETAPRIPWDRMNDIERITGKKVEWLLHGNTPDLMDAFGGAAPASDELGALREAVAAQAKALDIIARALAPLLQADRVARLQELQVQLDLPSGEEPSEDAQPSDEQSQ